MEDVVKMTPTDWLLGHDTGVSSKVIWQVMMGAGKLADWNACTPSDPDDFGRCYRLLRHFPHWLSRTDEVAHHYPAWKPMIDAWNELTAMYLQLCDEHGHYTHAGYEANKDVAKRMFGRMCELNNRSSKPGLRIEII